MTKSTIVFFLCGLVFAFCVAVWLYSLAPQGMLLYTPAPGTKANFTPSSSVGFLIAGLGLSAISALVAILSFLMTRFFNRRFLVVAKQATFLLIGFGVLCVLSMITEKFWP